VVLPLSIGPKPKPNPVSRGKGQPTGERITLNPKKRVGFQVRRLGKRVSRLQRETDLRPPKMENDKIGGGIGFMSKTGGGVPAKVDNEKKGRTPLK